MKTPMQEVYENFNLMSDADFKAWMLNTDLLEKEKEYMRETIGEQDLNARIAELEWEVSGLKEEIKNL